jgi:hypothetical protein
MIAIVSDTKSVYEGKEEEDKEACDMAVPCSEFYRIHRLVTNVYMQLKSAGLAPQEEPKQ